MLKITINNGMDAERSIYINDLLDVKVVQDAVIDEYQKVLAREVEDEKIELSRVLDAADCKTVSELQDWVEEVVELKRDLDNYGYDSVEDMMGRINDLEEAIDSIYWAANDVRP